LGLGEGKVIGGKLNTRPTETRRGKGKCPGCLKPVYRGGIRHNGRFWHERCFHRSWLL